MLNISQFNLFTTFIINPLIKHGRRYCQDLADCVSARYVHTVGSNNARTYVGNLRRLPSFQIEIRIRIT